MMEGLHGATPLRPEAMRRKRPFRRIFFWDP